MPILMIVCNLLRYKDRRTRVGREAILNVADSLMDSGADMVI